MAKYSNTSKRKVASGDGTIFRYFHFSKNCEAVTPRYVLNKRKNIHVRFSRIHVQKYISPAYEVLTFW